MSVREATSLLSPWTMRWMSVSLGDEYIECFTNAVAACGYKYDVAASMLAVCSTR